MPRRRRGKGPHHHDATNPRDAPARGSEGATSPSHPKTAAADNGETSHRIARTDGTTGACPSPLFSDDRIGYALLAVATVTAYSPVFRAGFVWDDYILVDFCGSDLGRSWGGLYDLWFRPSRLEDESHYWPMVYTTFWLENQMWGTNPLGYHVVNLMLHVANSCLVRRVMRAIGVPDDASWLAASVFALHPTRVESVAWVIERKDVLSGLFYLLALLRHPSVGGSNGVGTGTGRDCDADGARSLLASLALYVLGMLSKSIVVSLPVVLLLIPWMVRGGVTSAEARRSVPFFAAGVLLAGFDVYQTRAKDGHVDFDLTPAWRVLIASRALCSYLKQLVWPAGLMVVYPRWDPEEDGLVWAGCFLAVASASAAALCVLATARPTGGGGDGDTGGKRRRRQERELARRVLVAAFVFFGATLFPVLCLIDYGYMLFSYTADRFAYLAAVGPFALFAVAVCGGRGRGRDPGSSPFAYVWAILLATLGSLTHRQASVYVTEVAFYEHVVGHNPRAHKMQANLGHAYTRQDRDAEAVECYERSMRYGTDFPYRPLGIALQKLGRMEEAVEPLRRAAEPDSAPGKVWADLGNLYMKLDRNAEAAKSYAESLRRGPSPSTPNPYTNYGIVLRKLGKNEEAAGMLLRGLEDTSAQGNISGRKKNLNELGNAMSELGRYGEAVLYFRQALEIDPSYAIGWNNMANDLYRAGKAEDAVEAFRKAFEIDPNYNKARFNCAIVLGLLKRHDQQIELLRELLKREPGNKNAREQLDAALAIVR